MQCGLFQRAILEKVCERKVIVRVFSVTVNVRNTFCKLQSSRLWENQQCVYVGVYTGFYCNLSGDVGGTGSVADRVDHKTGNDRCWTNHSQKGESKIHWILERCMYSMNYITLDALDFQRADVSGERCESRIWHQYFYKYYFLYAATSRLKWVGATPLQIRPSSILDFPVVVTIGYGFLRDMNSQIWVCQTLIFVTSLCFCSTEPSMGWTAWCVVRPPLYYVPVLAYSFATWSKVCIYALST